MEARLKKEDKMPKALEVKVGRGEYKGHPLLVVGEGLRFPFQFGVGKAKLLLAVIEDLGPDGFRALLADFVAANPGKDE